MNFLEQLAAEWYAYNGYFVLTNRKYGEPEGGGFEGEVDVLAFHAHKREFLHIETSSDASSWANRKQKFRRQFAKAKRYYRNWLPCKVSEVKKIAIVGFALNPKVLPDYFGDGISIQSVPDFVAKITATLAKRKPMEEAVPEGFPLLRAIQFAVHYGRAADIDARP